MISVQIFGASSDQHLLMVDSGSSAIAIALKLAKIEPGDTVLLPAYHCPTMAAPIRDAGADVAFYRIHETTSVDIESVIENTNSGCKAIVVPHFFGIAQDMPAIKNLCNVLNLLLIEDCAHCLVGRSAESVIGKYGDIVIASTRKFFPGADGGYLLSPREPLAGFDIRSASIAEEVRAIYDVVQVSAEAGKFGIFGDGLRRLYSLKAMLSSKLASPRNVANVDPDNDNQSQSKCGKGYRRISRVSRYLVEHADIDWIIERRRKNFSRLRELLDNHPGFRSITPSLDSIETPYMFPLIADDSGLYSRVRKKAVPVWRWDDSSSYCDVSKYYSRHLIQVPCHQSLNLSEIEVIARLILGARTHQE